MLPIEKTTGPATAAVDRSSSALTVNQVTHELNEEARNLLSKGAFQRIDTQVGKGVGLLSFILAAASTPWTAWAWFFVGAGAITWATAVGEEKDSTGVIRPTPLSFTVDDILAGLVKVPVARRRKPNAFDHLSDADKARYYLCTDFRDEMAQRLAAADELSREPLMLRASNYLEENYREYFVEGQSHFRLYTPEPVFKQIATEMVGMLPGGAGDESIAVPEPLKPLKPVVSNPTPPPTPTSPPPAPLRPVPRPAAAIEVEVEQVALIPDSSEQPTPVLEKISLEVDSPPTKQAGASDGSKASLDDHLPQRGFNPVVLVQTPISLVWGSQGSGKTTLVEYLVYWCKSKKWVVTVADPHHQKGNWKGLTVRGKSRDMADCNDVLQEALDLAQTRYDERATVGTQTEEFKPTIYVLEEFTNWAGKCTKASEFIESACQDFRKVNIHVLIISHGRTLTATGGAKGMAETFKKGTLQLELKSKISAVELPDGTMTNLPRPTGKGIFSAFGAAGQEVLIPDLRGCLDIKDASEPGTSPVAEEEKKTPAPPAANPPVASGSLLRGFIREMESQQPVPEAIIALLRWLDNRSGEDWFTEEQIKGCKSLREFGYGRVATRTQALQLLLFKKVIKQVEGEDKTYLVV